MNNKEIKTATSLWGLSPLAVFLIVYLSTSIIRGDFYVMPITIAFLASSIYAIMITQGLSLEKRINLFTQGASHQSILSMIWIFALAGAFASGAKSIGTIDATVNAVLYILPESLLIPGVFVASCIISLSIGTSVGTVVALTPMAIGFASELSLSYAYVSAVVVGGAFFGDNLSFISDTTIASTTSQGCNMQDKFSANIIIALPAALATVIIYLIQSQSMSLAIEPKDFSLWLLLPYLIVLICTLFGMNVLLTLCIGIASCGIIAIGRADGQTFWSWIDNMGTGINGMGELIIVTLLGAGMLQLIQYNGGIDYLLQKLSGNVRTKRGAELSIAALVCTANICTANNTIAILSTGNVAKQIASRYKIAPKRVASLLDTFSCFIQGLLPYGAQLLLAASFAEVSPMKISQYLYYPFILGGFAVLSILMDWSKYSILGDQNTIIDKKKC